MDKQNEQILRRELKEYIERYKKELINNGISEEEAVKKCDEWVDKTLRFYKGQYNDLSQIAKNFRFLNETGAEPVTEVSSEGIHR